MLELLDYSFMRNALVAAILIGAAAPLVGIFLVQRRLSLIGDGLGHVALAGLDQLRSQGVAISFVLGHEAYYPRFGYSPELGARFASPFAGPHFMAMMLDKEAAWPLGGRADYAPAFGRMG